MSTMNISLPDSLNLILKDADLLHLRGLLLKGAASTPAAPIDASYFSTLRERVGHKPHGQRNTLAQRHGAGPYGCSLQC